VAGPPGEASAPEAGGGPFVGLADARHARTVAAALVASGTFTADLRMPRDQWHRWKSGILAPCGCNCRRLNAGPSGPEGDTSLSRAIQRKRTFRFPD
jgi:hypothetical protein